MKKIFGFALLCCFFLPKITQAAVVDPLVVQEKSIHVHISTTIGKNIGAGTTSTLYVMDLVSLSTTTGLFPHKDTGELDISGLSVVVDKIITTTGVIRVGIVNYISPSSASITWVYNNSFVNNSSYTIIPYFQFPREFIRGRVKSNATVLSTNRDGSTPWIVSNDNTTGSTFYTSTTPVNSPISAGTVLPRTGDIILEVKTFDATNTFTLNLDMAYHSEP